MLSSPDIGVVTPVSEGFLTASSRLLLRWTDQTARRRFDLDGSVAATGYGSQVEGIDSDLRLGGTYRQRISTRWAMDVTAGGWSSRRGSSGSVLDLDMGRTGLRAAWTPNARWLLSAGVLPSWLSFPQRPSSSDSTLAEWQQQIDLSTGALYRLGRERFLGLEFLYRRTTSNQDRSEYQGPQLVLRAGTDLPWSLKLTSFLSYAHRSYDTAPVLSLAPDETLDTLGVRRDEGWSFGGSLERHLNRRARVFLDASYLRQTSNDDYYGFDQVWLAAGISVDLGTVLPSRKGPSLQGAGPLAPEVTGRGVRFRLRAPQARKVALVGGFNGWDGERSPMAGPGEEGIWEVLVPIPAGVWRYAFLVDGEWISPPDAPRYEDDGFGGRNGVIHVR